MVDRVNKERYEIVFYGWEEFGFNDLNDIGELVRSVHIAEDEVREIKGFEGCDVSINVDREYEGPGTLYHIASIKNKQIEYLGVGIFEKDAA